MADTETVLLIHGGLWEDTGADAFWRRTGIIDGLSERGLDVIAPDRPRRATDWPAEARHLAGAIGDEHGLTVVGGSFGCAAAVRLALDFPLVTRRLVLAWPAALADQFTTIRMRAGLSRQGARGSTLDALLGDETLPGASDRELAGLPVPVGIIPADPPDPLHARSTVDALLRLFPSATELPGCPEAPRPEFLPHREAFLDAVAAFTAG